VLIGSGEKKAKQAYHLTFIKALLGGWMIGFGANLVHVMHGGAGRLATEAPVIVNFLAAAFFPIPLLMILITGMELITANLMAVPMAVANRRVKLWELPVNWILVFFGNLAGVLVYCMLLAQCSELYTSEPLVEYTVSVAMKKTHLGWGVCVLRGIGCNFLVCMGVWLATASREMSSKIIAMYLPAGLFVFLGFEHVAANMYFVPMGMLHGAPISVGRYVGSSVLPSFIGNSEY
jgi:formate/nitrite transporter